MDPDILETNIENLLGQDLAHLTIPAERRQEMFDALKTRRADRKAQITSASSAKSSATSSGKGLRSRWALAAVLAMLVVLVSGIMLNRHSKQPFEDRNAGIKADQVREADRHRPNPEHGTPLEDGSVVLARLGSVWQQTGPREIELTEGELYVLVAKQTNGLPFLVSTPHGTARATGTRFAVNTEPASTQDPRTSVAVAQGRVVLTGEHGEIDLLRGQEGILRSDQPPQRGPAARLTHVVNWAETSFKAASPEAEQKPAAAAANLLNPQLDLRRYHVDVVIENGVARTTIDQTFYNKAYARQEGTFYFPLPADAAVSRLAMYVFGERMEGGMVPRTRAQAIYNEIRHARREDPALLEMMEGNQFKLRIFPMEPRQEKRVLISYTQPVAELYGTLRYTFPMDHSMPVAGEISVKVRLVDGAEKYRVESSTHQFFRGEFDGDLVCIHEEKEAKPDRDILLHLHPLETADAGEDSVPPLLARYEHDGQHFAAARVAPRLALSDWELQPQPRQWFFIHDVSASRSHQEIQAQAHIINRFLAEADDADEVAVMHLSSRQPALSELVPIRSPEAFALAEQARQAIPLGGSRLTEALEAVRKSIRKHQAANPHIVYLGDGLGTIGAAKKVPPRQTAASRLQALGPDAPFIGIRVGNTADAAFLHAAAEHTRGLTTSIHPKENIDWRVFDLVASLNTPRLTKVAATFEPGGPAYLSAPTLSDGETLFVCARSNKPPKRLRLKGRLNGKPFEQVYTFEQADADASYLPRLWARAHINHLLKDGKRHQKDITKLSREAYVMSPFASLIVLENPAMYERFKVEQGRDDHWAMYPAPQKIPFQKQQDNRFVATFADTAVVWLDDSSSHGTITEQVLTADTSDGGGVFYTYDVTNTGDTPLSVTTVDAGEELVITPARYDTRESRVMASLAGQRVVTIPAQFQTDSTPGTVTQAPAVPKPTARVTPRRTTKPLIEPPAPTTHHTPQDANIRWIHDLSHFAYGAAGVYGKPSFGHLRPVNAASIAAAVRQEIADARAALPCLQLQQDGATTTVWSNGRFEKNRRMDMYFQETIVGDGKMILLHYPELGFAGRYIGSVRPWRAGEWPRGWLEEEFPFLLPSIEELLQHHTILLEPNENDRLSLLLTPQVGGTNRDTIQLLSTRDGRLLKRTVRRDNEITKQLSWTHHDDHVVQTLELPGKPARVSTSAVVQVELPFVEFEERLVDQIVCEHGVNNLPETRLEKQLQDQRMIALNALKSCRANGRTPNIKRHFEQRPGLGGYGGSAPKAIRVVAGLQTDAGKPVSRGDIVLAMGIEEGSTAWWRKVGGLDADDLMMQYFALLEARDFDGLGTFSTQHPNNPFAHLAGFVNAANEPSEEKLKRFLKHWPESPLTTKLVQNFYVKHNQEVENARAWRTLSKTGQANKAIALWTLCSGNHSTTEDQEALVDWLVADAESGTMRTELPRRFLKPTEMRDLLERYAEVAKTRNDQDTWLRFAKIAGQQKGPWAEQGVAALRHGLDLDQVHDRLVYADLLRTARRYKEATAEYRRAIDAMGDETPVSDLRLAANTADLARDYEQALRWEVRAIALDRAAGSTIAPMRYQNVIQWCTHAGHPTRSKGKPDLRNELTAIARRHFEHWRQRHPGSKPYEHLARALQANEQGEDEIWESLSSIIDLKPEDPAPYQTVGGWYLSINMDEGLSFLERAAELSPADPNPRLHYANYLSRKNYSSQARKEYKKIIDGDWAPGFNGVVRSAESNLRSLK